MKVAALLSGGKDSLYAVYIAQQYGWDVTHLVTLLSENKDSWMYHAVNIHLTPLIAQALNIPLISTTTKGQKETELKDLQSLLKPLDIDGVISGAIQSEYQRTRIEHICHNLNIKSFTPLWHKTQHLILKEQINAGFKIIIVSIAAAGFTESWLGKPLTPETLKELEAIQHHHHINIAGEGGEYETLVVDGPLFIKKIVIDEAKKEWKRDHGTYHILKAHLA